MRCIFVGFFFIMLRKVRIVEDCYRLLWIISEWLFRVINEVGYYFGCVFFLVGWLFLLLDEKDIGCLFLIEVVCGVLFVVL